MEHAVADVGGERGAHHSVHVDDAVAGTDSLSAAHKAQHIKPARSKDEMFS